MRLYLLLILGFLYCTISYSQVDSTYIGTYPHKITLKGYMAKDFLYMNHEINEKDISYMPNNPLKIGLGGSINNTVISFGYGYGFDFMRSKRQGKTKSFDFQFHNYGNKFIFDLFIQKYKGFYIDDEDEKNIVLCPDLRIRQYGINTQYVFNNKKFSYKAAFDQSEKQLKSAGSILVGMGGYLTKIASDSSFMYKDKSLIRSFQIGFSGGYTYTWVLSRHWFVNGSVTAGMTIGSEKASEFFQKVKFSPTAFPRISAGYNRNHWSLGFTFIGNMTSPSYSRDENINLFTGSFGLTYTYRIQSLPIRIPILSKLIE